MAGRIDALLKLSVVASLLLASSSVGYYYVVYLPGTHALQQEKAEAEKLARNVPSDNCALPRELARDLSADLDKKRNRCLQESRAGSQ